MKNILIVLLGIVSISISAQDLPTPPTEGFSFPLGSKFTLKLHPVDSVNYTISVIAFEGFSEIVDTFNKSHLFQDEGEENTIVGYFCLSTFGITEEEMDKNMKVSFIFKSFCKDHLEYKSDIQKTEEGAFEFTSNLGMFSKAIGNEMWPYMIHYIALHSFQKITILDEE